ncbi:MAG: AarF/ABC1/UbiB kinase family protein, partial [candidate division Zixibacteria bacterium]|nr:AarF/ABC1/UbiB kinase family protein [candidate division Zixibacteria bacterium]
QQEIAALSWAERIRLALDDLGPTFVKMGQIMSTRPFLIPVELVIELAKLQDQVAPFPFAEVRQTIEEELGKPLDQLFKSFSPDPVASASLSQVHRATTLDGDDVAVKVQRPQVKQIMEKDLSILRDLAVLLDRYIPEVRQFSPVAIVDEVAKSAKQEVDFLYEARNLEIFAQNFADDDRIFLPRVFWDHTSLRVLTLSFIDGIKISDVARLREAGVDLAVVTRAGGQLLAKQIFEFGFFHADPHPGNLFVLRDNRIAPVDFGMMGKLSQGALELVADLLIAATSNDTRRIVRVLQNHELLDDDVRPATLEADLALFLHRYHGVPLAKLKMRSLLTDAFEIMNVYRIKFPPELMMLGKALGTYEEVARTLNPQYDFVTELLPSIKKLATRKFSPGSIFSDVSTYLLDLRELLVNFPFEIRRIARNLRKGDLSISFHHKGLEHLILELEKASNRLAFALIIASLIVASSLIMTRPIGLTILGVPALGLVGYVTAGVLGIWLVIAILRSGKL